MDNYGYIPPQARELEKAILGAIMLEKEAYDTAAGLLKPECFYVDAHQQVFKAFQELSKLNLPVDLLTTAQQLGKQGKLDEVGGAYFLTQLTREVVSGVNVAAHSQMVFQKFLQREVIRITSELTKKAYDDTVDAFELLEYAEKQIASVSLNNLESGMLGIDKVVWQAVDTVTELYKQGGVDITGVPGGFKDLDKATRGWQPGDLILLGARPSAGKTAFALNIALTAAENGEDVAVWSLEMKAALLAIRMLAARSDIFLYRLQTGKLNEQDIDLLKKTAEKIASLPIFFDQNTNVTIASVKRKARRLKKDGKLKLIIIDYIQLMSGDDDRMNREREIAKISRELKNLAQELHVPIIALSQLSRAEGASKMVNWEYGPPANALRESGALEQDADVIMMLWGPSDEDVKQDASLLNRRRVRLVKQRNGVLITQELEFRNEVQLFKEFSEPTGMPGGNWKPVQ